MPYQATPEGDWMISDDGSVYCDCCTTEKVAEIREDKVVIKVRRHGENHTAVITIQELLDNAVKKGYAFNNTVTS